MRKSTQLILFLKNLATGILAPVLTLSLLQHGANIRTVSLIIGLYSFTIILAEFPSGVFADLYGRKTSFLLSTVFLAVSYGVFFLSRAVVPLCVAVILNGLGRAFASGSLDALVIDQAEDYGKSLQWITSRFAILESAGLAIGALAGGFLGGLGTRYLGNLAFNAGTYALLFVLTLLFVHEPPKKPITPDIKENLRRFGEQTKSSLSFLKRGGLVTALFVFTIVTGVSLGSVEIYWQPALAAMTAPKWLFGALSFGGFAVVMIGSWASERLLSRFPRWGAALMLLFKTLLGGSLVLLLFQSGQIPFVMVYLLIYLFLGGGSVAESTLLNRLAPAQTRAGILSLFSLMLQIGGLIASAGGFFMSAYSRYQNMWPLAGGLMLLCVALFGIQRLRAGRISAQPEPEPETEAE